MKRLLILGVLGVLLVGCDTAQDQQLRAERTKENAANPEIVTTLPDGRAVRRITVERYDHNHHVYFIDGAEVSANYAVQQGKVTEPRVMVSLPPNPTPDQVIEAAEKLKQEQAARDLEEYNRLKAKFEK